MSRIVNVQNAKPQSTRLIDDVDAAKQKHLGLLNGKIQIPDDFNVPLDEEIINAFEGAEEKRRLKP